MRVLAGALLGAALAGCAASPPSRPSGRQAPEAGPPPCGPGDADRRACRKPWTLLVYMAADNDLQPEALRDLQEMECPPGEAAPDAASAAGADVVVQLDLREPAGRFRLHMERSGGPCAAAASLAGVTSPRVEVAPEETGPPEDSLEGFLEWGINAYPAERYAVILWDHGFGYRPAGAGPGDPGGIAVDVSQGTVLDTPSLGAALAAASARALGGRPFDVVAADASRSQSLEIAAEIAGAARFLVGSEQGAPIGGLPYHRLVPWLNGARPMPPAPASCGQADAACRVAALFPEALRAAADAGEGRSAAERADLRASFTMSALDGEAVRGALHPAMHRLGAALTAWIQEDPLRAVDLRALLLPEVAGPGEPRVPAFPGDQRDVGVLLARLSGLLADVGPAGASPASAPLAGALASARAALGSAVIAASFGEQYTAGRYPAIAGVSVWVPHDAAALRDEAALYAGSRFFAAPPGQPAAWGAWLEAAFAEEENQK